MIFQQDNPSDLSKLVIPINVRNTHWILCVMQPVLHIQTALLKIYILQVVDFKEHKIVSYDSLNHTEHPTECTHLQYVLC